jgi:hypothetical protein
MSELTIKESPAESLTLTPKHIPLPGQLLQMKAQGLGVEAIAQEIRQSIRTTRELLSQAQRSATVRAARDILIRDLIPQIVDNIAAGLDRENATRKDLEVADFSLKLAERIGITDMSGLAASETTKTETFEEFMWKRTVKHESPATTEGPGHGAVVASASVDLSTRNPASDACIDAEIVEPRGLPALPDSNSP